MKNIRILIIILFVLVNISKSNAQLQGQARLDSLLKELPKSKEDTNKVKLLSDISYDYNNINPQIGITYGTKALKLAEKLNWNKGFAKSYYSLGTNFHSKSEFPKALEFYKKSLKYFNIDDNILGKSLNLGNIGTIYHEQSEYNTALKYYKKALELNIEADNKSGIANNYGNIGNIFYDQSDFPKALEYFNKSLKIYESIEFSSGIATNLSSIGNVYYALSDYPKSLEYYDKSLKINRRIGNLSSIAINLVNIGNIYEKQNQYEKAIEYYKQSLDINTKIGNQAGISNNLINIGTLYNSKKDYKKALEYYDKSITINKMIDNKLGVGISLGNIGETYLILSQDSILNKYYEGREKQSIVKEINLNKSINYTKEAIDIFRNIGERHNLFYALKNLSVAYKLRGDYKDAYNALEESKSIQDSVFNIEKSNEISKLENARENLVKDRKIAILNEREKSSARERNIIIISASIGLILILLVLLVIINQRRKSEALLLNILPAKIAKRLKSKEVSIADDIENATTIFIDLVGFTSFAKDKKASEVLKILNNIFSRIDKLVSEYGLEKIKTIGDGYMAAAGVPEPISDHAEKAVEFTLAVRNEIEKFNTEKGMNISARMGLESGPLVAGVIGDSKFIYDLWGDSVNTASRMESTGLPNQIQITENVKQELESVKTSYQFTPREPIEVKGRGIMHTYFIERAEIISTK